MDSARRFAVCVAAALLWLGCSEPPKAGPPAPSPPDASAEPDGAPVAVDAATKAPDSSADASPVAADANAAADAPPRPLDAAGSATRSAGCGTAKMAGVFQIAAGAAMTDFRVVLPRGYDGTKPYPLVFYLHGRGNGIEGQRNLNTDVADADLGILVYPKSYAGSGWEVPNRDHPEENLALLK